MSRPARPCLGCGQATRNGSRCPACQSGLNVRRDAARGSSSARGYGAEHRKLREAVLVRDEGRCRWCGGPARTADHVVPLAHGGQTTLDNLAAACSACNSRRGGMTRR